MKNSIPLPMERTLFFAKDVDQESIEELSRAIIEINEDDKLLKKMYKLYNLDYTPQPIKIMIDTFGGEVHAALGLLGIMDNSKTPIHTIATGAAMSCGFMILIHGHKRFAYKHATPMYHQISFGAWGEVQHLEEQILEGKKIQKKWEELVVEKTKITKKQLKEIKKKKTDWHMPPEDALKFGVIDEIV
jgi:ATP-dependent Clp protease protease subunit